MTGSKLERLAGAAARVKPPSPRRLGAALTFPYRAPTVPRGMEVPPEADTLGSSYDTDWARRFPARFTRVVLLEAAVRPLARVVAHPDRRGYDHLAGMDGAVIFAANHHSHVDAGLLLSSIPEPWRYKVFTGAAADYFFTSRVTSAVSALALGAIPIERSEVTRRSADQAAELIDDGWSMVIFPEGGRSPDGWGQKFRGGAAYLAIRCHVPVVPVHIEGTSRILAKGTKRLRPGRTRVTFGAALRPEADESSRRFAARLEAAVAALGDEVAGDWYSARKRAHAGTSPGMTGPDISAWRRTWALGDRRGRRGGRAPSTTPRWPDV